MRKRRRVDDIHFGVIEGIDIDAMIREDTDGTDDEWLCALSLFGIVRHDDPAFADPPVRPPGVQLINRPPASVDDSS